MEETDTKPSPSETDQTPLQQEIRFSIPTENNLEPVQEAPKRKYRKVKKKKPEEEKPLDFKDIKGVVTIILSIKTQTAAECIVGEHVTSENPWKDVLKDLVVDHLELEEENSEFWSIQKEILEYPHNEILLVYVPSETSEYDEFNVCSTVEAKEAVSDIINNILQEREVRLSKAVTKTAGKWKSLGSEIEIELEKEKINRPSLEVELESEYPAIALKSVFRLRLVENAIDGYMELITTRQTFSNIYRNRMDIAIQATPLFVKSEAQTTYPYPKHISTQYHFEYGPPPRPTKELVKNMKKFLDDDWDSFSDLLYVNSNFNLYNDDYKSLVRNDTNKNHLQLITPHASFAEPHICKRKEISCHSWHRLYTGIFVAAYRDTKASDYVEGIPNRDDVLKAIYDATPVLLWSFKDTLQPRLLLESPREVTALAFCPYDENILVGGCINGQIIVWDITNKLRDVEEEEILTDAQMRYRILMHSLINWMKNTKNPRIVRVTAVSDMDYSHQTAVTSISWLSPFREITKTGLLRNLPEDDNQPGYQFVTSSKDGSLMAWNLRSKPTATPGSYRPQRRLRRLKKRPSALTVDVSPYRLLNRLLKPSFKINIFAPNTNRPLPITVLAPLSVPLKYVEKDPNPNRKFDITERLLFRPVLERPGPPPPNQFCVGTTEGDFILGSWEGFEFNAGEIVNKDTAKFINIGRYHDGPILSVSNSPAFPDLILTVGGKIFAIWKVSFVGKPILWRRSKVRYVHGSWNVLRPGLFKLIRADGCSELWSLKTRSDKNITVKTVSHLSADVTSIHPFSLEQNIIGLVDGKGTFRTFYISKEYDKPVEEDRLATMTICNREVERKQKFIKWQDEWAIKNREFLNEMRQRNTAIEQEKVEKLKMEKEQDQAAQEEERKRKEKEWQKLRAPEPGRLEEWHKERWLANEKARIMRVVLKKKALDVNTLRKQEVPLLQAKKDLEIKKKKQESRLNQANSLFEDAVAMLFPDAVEKKLIQPRDPYAGGDSTEIKRLHFNNYKDEVDSCQEYVDQRRYTHHFDWLKLLGDGKERRKVLDGFYNRYNHKLRLVNEKMKKEKEELVNRTAASIKPEEKRSLESIDYEIDSDEENG